MKRTIVLGAIVAVGAMGVAVAAFQQPAGGPQGQVRTIEVDKLHDSLFVLRGGGGNTAVFVQASGVTVVDTKNPGWGQPILDKIKELTNKPVTMVINTHTHGDHVSGNVEFPANVEIVTQVNTQENMKKMVSPPGFQKQGAPRANIFEEHKGRGMPTRTFNDRLTLGTGADQIDVWYFGRGHTNGDAIVVFPSLRVMHMGDLFPGKQMPIMDTNNGGSGLDYSGTLRKTHDGVPGIETIITGHSTQMAPKDLLEFSQFIEEFVSAVRAGRQAGRSAEDIAASWKASERFAGYTVSPERIRANVEVVLKELQ